MSLRFADPLRQPIPDCMHWQSPFHSCQSAREIAVTRTALYNNKL